MLKIVDYKLYSILNFHSSVQPRTNFLEVLSYTRIIYEYYLLGHWACKACTVHGYNKSLLNWYSKRKTCLNSKKQDNHN